MSNKSENTQFQNATASTLKAISGDLESEREINFLEVQVIYPQKKLGYLKF